MATVHRINAPELKGRLIDGIPVAECVRAVVDSASVLTGDELEATVDAVIRQRLATVDSLNRQIERIGTSGRKGLGTLARLLADRDVSARVPESAINRLVGQLLVDAGLPRPVYELVIRTGGRFVARADLAYPEARLAIECDSERWHRTRRAFVADPRRRNRMLVAGYRVLSFTWDDYATRPDEIVATVATTLTQTSQWFGRSATSDVA